MQENSRKNKDIGDEGERVASECLRSEGFKIIARNFRCKAGEIDIIAKRGGELHFIEVKTRSNPGFVSPIEVVTEKKRGRIRRAAEWYLNDTRNGFKGKSIPPCIFSVIGIDFSCDEPQVVILLDAFV